MACSNGCPTSARCAGYAAARGSSAAGEVARFTATGPGRFVEADAWWRAFTAGLDVRDEVGVEGTGPVAFTSFTFADSSPGSVVVVPRVVVGRAGGRTWITEIADETPRPMRSVRPVRPSGPLQWADGRLPVSGYRAAVAEAVRRMQAGALDKVALAHDLLAVAGAPLDPRFVLGRLAGATRRAGRSRWTGSWARRRSCCCGAAVRRRVAGAGRDGWSEETAPADGAAGAAAAVVGQGPPRARATVESLVPPLRPLHAGSTCRASRGCSRSATCRTWSPTCTGSWTADDPTVAAAARRAVHPTAAVGGTPRAAAVALIPELEGMDRGRYAGPVGWMNADGDGELGIALRCAQLDGPVARLFAGCGIVAGSKPDAELAESEAKLVPVRDALRS